MPTRPWIAALLFTASAGVLGCGGSAKTEPAAATGSTGSATTPAASSSSEPSTSTTTEATPVAQATPAQTAEKPSQPAKAATAKGNSAPATPATTAELAKLLDLRKLGAELEKQKPLQAPEKNARTRHSIVSVSCNLGGNPPEVFALIKKSLTGQKWKELAGGYSSDQGASGTFEHGDFKLSVSAFGSGKPGETNVSILNLGNVDANKLPAPAGAKSLYSTPINCAFLSEGTVEAEAEAAKERFTKLGWEPYGTAGDAMNFRKNAIKLMVRVSSAPAQGGKTVIDYSSLAMAVEFPLFPEAIPDTVQYSDNPAQIGFDSEKSQADVGAYYRETLEKQGWKATTENFVEIDNKNMIIFRNEAKDLMELEVITVDDKTRAMVRFQTAEEVEAIDKAVKEEIERRNAEKNKPLPKQGIKVPEGASEVEVTAKRIEFQVEAGTAQAVVKALKQQLLDAGWKQEDEMLEKLFGQVTLNKEKTSVEISYTETGVLPSEIRVTGRGVELEQAK
ncbi:MAG: hypothetical protein ACO1RA_00215 [Planctomycetaceae bacterium]